MALAAAEETAQLHHPVTLSPAAGAGQSWEPEPELGAGSAAQVSAATGAGGAARNYKAVFR